MQKQSPLLRMAANERIKIGNLLKGVPIGFFNENSLGEVTGVCTTVLGNVEMLVPMVLVDIMGGLIGTVVFTAMILIFEWRAGLVALAQALLCIFLSFPPWRKSPLPLRRMRKSRRRHSPPQSWNMCRGWASSSPLI